ncbi:MAG: SGNH/GDSL hydrolase family protein [Xanthobacteraceae bacterium]|nr:SGNH/GDSL hydrolase family protein [Xanthobacteraceae bacterium]
MPSPVLIRIVLVALVSVGLHAGYFPDAVAAERAAPETAQQSVDDAKPGLTAKAIEAARQAANKAGDILTRIPCLSPTGDGAVSISLPRVAKKLRDDEPVVIVAFGSSSTAGYGSSSAAYTYPNRLAEQLRRKFPKSRISVINRGIGGQEVPDMVARLQSSVLDSHPDLVIWQLGTNSVVRGHNSSEDIAPLIEEGVSRMQAQGADVVLIDPQYVPAVTAKPDDANRMVKLIKHVASLRHASVFPRFEVMRQWHENEKMPFDSFSISDGLHMNDWGYACFAQLLGDMIIKSVNNVKVDGAVSSSVISLRPK